MSEPDYLKLFFEAYPKPTGIGAVRNSWSAQIFFHGANPEQIYKAAVAYRKKMVNTDYQYIPRPSRWLDDQTYLDPDLQETDEEPLEGWQKKLADLIGLQRFKVNCKNAELLDDTLYLDKPQTIVDIFKNKFYTEMRLCGITDVKKAGVSGEIPRLQNL